MRARVSMPAAAALLALALGAAPARSDALPADHDVKAALLFNFLKFVEWPEARGPLALCIFGETPVLAAAAALDGRSVGGRAVSVRRASEATRCDVALVPDSAPAAERLATRLAAQGALVVGDGGGLAARGAHLGFYVEEQHVRFEANVRAIRRDGLRVSSKLLRLARIVGGST
jgi:hypothetical protein